MHHNEARRGGDSIERTIGGGPLRHRRASKWRVRSAVRTCGFAALILAHACGPSARDVRVAEPTVAAPSASVPTKTNLSVTPQKPPHVVVAVVVDQFAAWVAEERLRELPRGFARLLKEGTWYTDVRFAHAITETAPGHASLYTGRAPHDHGISANELWSGGRARPIVADDTVQIVTGDEVRSDASSSIRALNGKVVADRLKEENPAAQVFAFSLKDRGTIFGAGHHPDLALWYDTKLGRFVTSTVFARALPDWMKPVTAAHVVQERLKKPWELLDADWVRKHARAADDQRGEANYDNFGSTFPHDPMKASQPFMVFRDTPESDRLVLELALLALDHAKQPSTAPIMLAVSLSANDYIGHVFGPDSWEAWDAQLRLDASLGWFFDELDRRQGADNWSLVLSADHGVAPLPEVSERLAKEFHAGGTVRRPMGRTYRISQPQLLAAARKIAAQALGKGEWIDAFVDPYIYLSPKARELPERKRQQLTRALTDQLARYEGIAKAYDTTQLGPTCPEDSDDSMDALVCRSVFPGRGGDFYLAMKPGYFFDPNFVPGFGTSHGNASLSDRSVPVLIRAPGVAEPGAVIKDPQSFRLYSQLLAKLLHVSAP